MNDTPMPSPEDNPAALRALLGRLRQPPCSEVPGDEELVRWLDGTLPPDRAAHIETIFLQHPDLRRALIAARLALPQPIPAAELARLVALAPQSATNASVIPFSVSRAGQRLQYLLAAAAAVALLAPAWNLGAKLARTRVALETRELRELVRLGMNQGGL